MKNNKRLHIDGQNNFDGESIESAADQSSKQGGSRAVFSAFRFLSKAFLTGSESNSKADDIIESYEEEARPGEDPVSTITRLSFGKFRIVVLISVIVSLIALVPPIYSMLVFDRVIPNSSVSTLVTMSFFVVAFLAFDFFMKQKRSKAFMMAGSRLDAILNVAVLKKQQSLPLMELESKGQAYWNANFVRIERVRNFATGALVNSLFESPIIVIGILFLLFFAWPALVVVLVCMAVVILMTLAASKSVNRLAQKEVKRSDDLRSQRFGLIGNRLGMKNLCHDQLFQDMYIEKYNKWIAVSHEKMTTMHFHRNLSSVFLLSTNTTVIGVCAIAAMNGYMSPGALLGASIVSQKILSPLINIVVNWETFALGMQSKDELNQFLLSESEGSQSTADLHISTLSVTVEDLSFKHSNSNFSLFDGLNLKFEGAGLYILCGGNGSGKSTLLKILRGLYKPSKGRVLFDVYNTANYSTSSLARWFGYMPQSIQLFPGSVMDNIKMANPNLSDANLSRHMNSCGLSEFYSEGNDSALHITDGGSGLSGGQRRKVGYAQALSHVSKVLLFDEPTNDLDEDSKIKMLRQIISLAQTKMVFLVTHDALFYNYAKQIVTLVKGKDPIVESREQFTERLKAISKAVNVSKIKKEKEKDESDLTLEKGAE